MRSQQTTALHLPLVGVVPAVDLGDVSSPYGNVHFRHKQLVARRAVGAALRIAFGKTRQDTQELWAEATSYPSPLFLTQSVNTVGNTVTAQVSFAVSPFVAAG